ncbi:MAG: ethylbenzene dehydrogenase-related protein [bacterium]
MKNISGVLLLVLILNSAGCSLPGDRLYVFKIDHIPSEHDWENSLSYYVPVENGRLNQNPPKLSKLDKETIHASNKTCHHTDPSSPVKVKFSAFYNKNNLFLRIQWPDKSKNERPALWDNAAKTFNKTKGNEDGLGIIWNTGKNISKNCLSSCHLNEWQVQNSILTPTHQMKTKNNEIYNLWIWWAARNARDNFIWSINLDSSGIDENKYFLQNPERTSNIYSKSCYKNGLWTLTITYPLNDPGMEFSEDNPYHFQIAVFDDTYSDHSISSEIQEMVFVQNDIKVKDDDLFAERE